MIWYSVDIWIHATEIVLSNKDDSSVLTLLQSDIFFTIHLGTFVKELSLLFRYITTKLQILVKLQFLLKICSIIKDVLKIWSEKVIGLTYKE